MSSVTSSGNGVYLVHIDGKYIGRARNEQMAYKMIMFLNVTAFTGN